jgi:hypothetical protein
MPAALKHFDKTGGTQIMSKVWPNAYAGAIQTPEKFYIENSGDRPLLNLYIIPTIVGSNDGIGQFRLAADVRTLRKPYGLTGVLAAGGSFAAGEYGFCVSATCCSPPTGFLASVGGSGGTIWAGLGGTGVYTFALTTINAFGESAPVLKTATIASLTQVIDFSWDAVAGATGYRLYLVNPDDSFYFVIASGATITYDDFGTTLTGTVVGEPPTIATSVGETCPSVEYVVTIGASQKITLSWQAVAGATYRIYRTAINAAGTYGATSLVGISATATFEDTGTATVTGTPQLINTSDGGETDYGTPPTTFTIAALYVGHLAIGQDYSYWANRVVGSGVSEIGNDRAVSLVFQEG